MDSLLGASPKRSIRILLGFSVLVGLYLTSRFNYLLFHGLAELFSIVVACGIFMIAWNSRQIMRSTYLLFLGIAYLFVGSMDMVHTLAYTGMGVFPEATTDLPTQLWIAARYMESISLLIAPLFIDRKLRAEIGFAVFSAVFVVLLGSIFYWQVFPECFVEGVGLTTFKRLSEYIICLILIASIIGIFTKREAFDRHVLRLVVASIVLTIFSEFCFTLYASAYAPANAIGHLFKIASFYLIYQALIHTGLEKPYTLLFRELKQSEEALKVSERRYARAEEIGRLGHWDHDFDTDRVFWSEETYQIFGVDPEHYEPSFESFLSLVISSDSDALKHEIEAALTQGEPLDTEYRITRPDGTQRVLHALAEVRLTENGKPAILSGTVQDITERKHAEERIQRQNEFLQSVLESLTHPFYVINVKDYSIELANSAAHPAGSLQGLACYALTHKRDTPCDGREHPCPVEEARRTRKAAITEHIHYDKDGNPRHVEVHGYPIFDGDGNVVQIIEYSLDITERKRAEEELRESEARYRRLSESLEETVRQKVAELKQAERLATIGQMVSVVSHEIRNPLQNIRFGVDLLRGKAKKTEDQQELLGEIEGGIEMLDGVVAELLTFARPVSLEYTRSPVGDIVRQSLKAVSDKLDTINVILSVDQEDREILVDVNRITRVLVNLILNAVEAMPGGGDLKVGCAFSRGEPDGAVTFSIMDTGCGIHEGDLKLVEEPFFTTKMQGTGLGIPICLRIIEAHQGIWTITSTVNKGTTVEVTLPAQGPMIDGKLGDIVI